MAIQQVPVMRVKVDPNPRGSATTHVSMPASNPFEREEISVRPANQPREMLPGMGDVFSDPYGTQPTPIAPEPQKEESSFDWGGLFSNITSRVADVGATYAKSEIEAQQQADLIKKQQAAEQQTALMRLVSAGAQKVPVTNTPQIIPVVNPAPQGLMQPQQAPSSKLPWIIGGAVVLGIGAMFLMKGKRRR